MFDELRRIDFPYVPRYGEGLVYFVDKQNWIVGVGKYMIGSVHGGSFKAEIIPYDDDAKHLFRDDEILKQGVGLYYDGYYGEPLQRFSDEPHDRHKGTRVISKNYIDNISFLIETGDMAFHRQIGPYIMSQDTWFP